MYDFASRIAAAEKFPSLAENKNVLPGGKKDGFKRLPAFQYE